MRPGWNRDHAAKRRCLHQLIRLIENASLSNHQRDVLPWIEWAAHTSAAPIQDVDIDHRGTDIAMAQQLLHRTDVITILNQVRRKRVPERMAAPMLGNPRLIHCPPHRSLKIVLQHVVPPNDPTPWIARPLLRQKHILPGPGIRRPWILSFQRIRKLDRPVPLGQIQRVQPPAVGKLLPEAATTTVRQQRDSILRQGIS